MSWRNQGSTGTNNIPLGNRRRFGGQPDDDSSAPPPPPESSYPPPPPSYSAPRPPSPVYRAPPPPAEPHKPADDLIPGEKRGRSDDREPRRRKKNRWGAADDNKALGLIGLPTAITSNMTSEQLEAYALHLRLEEIGQKLKINDVVPPDDERSPSPAPQYDSFGRRTNTREVRYRKKLEDERHRLVDKAMRTIPDFKPPADYRRPTKTQEKIYIPVNDYPEINFIGLLIGPRGNTLKKMETESGAKIAIRGKGSVKEGKGRSDAAANSNLEEDLHCLIMADSEDKIKKAIAAIEKIIETAASIPEGQNDLKRNQLRELAMLNGTLRDDENQICQNCGNKGHRKYDCPEQRNYTANIICRICGNAGHMARDCTQRNDPYARNQGDAVDREYASLMQELGHGGSGQIAGRIEGPAGGDSSAPPWAAQQTAGGAGAPPPWQQAKQNNLPPWQQQDRQGGAAPGMGGAAPPPWQLAAAPAPGYGAPDAYGVDAGYGAAAGGYGAPPGMGASAPAPWAQAAQGYGAYGAAPPVPGYDAYGAAAGAPPPPPGGDAYGAPPPPPPGGDAYGAPPPPPPAGGAYPPPPPSEPAPPPPPPQ
ncbi:Branchpoint-bridging protein [Saitoella coloradoensis]